MKILRWTEGPFKVESTADSFSLSTVRYRVRFWRTLGLGSLAVLQIGFAAWTFWVPDAVWQGFGIMTGVLAIFFTLLPLFSGLFEMDPAGSVVAFAIDRAGIEFDSVAPGIRKERRRLSLHDVECFVECTDNVFDEERRTVAVRRFDGTAEPVISAWLLSAGSWGVSMSDEQRARWLAELLNREAERLWPEPVERAAKAGKAET